jgi:hypothetical protein
VFTHVLHTRASISRSLSSLSRPHSLVHSLILSLTHPLSHSSSLSLSVGASSGAIPFGASSASNNRGAIAFGAESGAQRRADPSGSGASGGEGAGGGGARRGGARVGKGMGVKEGRRADVLNWKRDWQSRHQGDSAQTLTPKP